MYEGTIYNSTMYNGTMHNSLMHICMMDDGTMHDGTMHDGTMHDGTGKSFSEALILASTNPKYDKRFFIELRVQYMKTPSSEHVELNEF